MIFMRHKWCLLNFLFVCFFFCKSFTQEGPGLIHSDNENADKMSVKSMGGSEVSFSAKSSMAPEDLAEMIVGLQEQLQHVELNVVELTQRIATANVITTANNTIGASPSKISLSDAFFNNNHKQPQSYKKSQQIFLCFLFQNFDTI